MKTEKKQWENNTAWAILLHVMISAVSLFINGFGVYLTIHAQIGAAPWDVFNLGLSKTFGIVYGNASIAVSCAVILVDVVMREPIGISMFIDAVVVGKTVDLFDMLEPVPVPKTMVGSVLMLLIGLFIIGYSQYLYMKAALGCGPRDTLLVALKKRIKKIPIGCISILILSAVTFAGYLLGGQVGVGTILCAFGAGPIMQFAFYTVGFDATHISHQSIVRSIKIFKISLQRIGKKDDTREKTE